MTGAIRDVAALGFRGIQLRSNILKEYGTRPQVLRDLLAANNLEMICFSSGGVSVKPGDEAAEIAKHTAHARFVRDVGGKFLQLSDGVNRRTHQPVADDFKRLGRTLTEIGKRAADYGIPVGYHNHMNNLGESPDEVNRIMDASDAAYVKLLLDIAHYQQGGGDPSRAIRQYANRLMMLHIKDVESPVPNEKPDARGNSYRFVELGRGRVRIADVFKALDAVNYRGWAIIELDSVPDGARSPKEAAEISKRYLQQRVGVKM